MCFIRGVRKWKNFKLTTEWHNLIKVNAMMSFYQYLTNNQPYAFIVGINPTHTKFHLIQHSCVKRRAEIITCSLIFYNSICKVLNNHDLSNFMIFFSILVTRDFHVFKLQTERQMKQGKSDTRNHFD